MNDYVVSSFEDICAEVVSTYPLHPEHIMFLVTANLDVLPLYKSSRLTAIWCMMSKNDQKMQVEF